MFEFVSDLTLEVISVFETDWVGDWIQAFQRGDRSSNEDELM